MNRSRIRYFLYLAEALNFSDAARHFRITQPALSKAIKRLEEELGGTLIRREGRLTHLTPLGRAMVEKLADVESATRAAEQTAQRLTLDGIQRLNVAVMCTIAPRRIVPFLAKFQREHSNIELALDDIEADRIVDLLLLGHCDLAILATPFDTGPRLRQTELYREGMVVALPRQHRFAGREGVSLTDLEREPYVDRLNCEFRDTFNKAFRDSDVMLDVAFSSQREDWVQDAVATSIGVSIMPEDAVDTSRLGSCPITPDPFWRTVSIAVATGREDNEAVRSVIAAASKHDWQQE